MLFNPRSLNNKVDAVMGYIEDKSIDIAGICETWLTDSSNATTAIIKSFGYSIFHDYREKQKGGGTALIYRSCLKLTVTKFTQNFKSFEATAGLLKNATTKFMFLIIYRTGPLCSTFNQELDKLLCDCSSLCDNVFLAGDINIHFTSVSGLTKSTLDIMSSYGLSKLISDATHCSGGSLDQIFSSSVGNKVQFSTSVDSLSGLGLDHHPVLCDITFSLEKKYFKTVVYRKLKDVDSDSFSDELNNLIDGIDRCDSFEVQVHDLTTSFGCLLDQHAPFVTKKVAVVDSAPWFDTEYRELRKKRRRAERKKSKSHECHMIYKNLCEEANLLCNLKKKEYFKKILDNSRGNPKTLYKMVNNVMDRKQGKALPDNDNLEELASTFNTFFVEKISKIRETMNTCSHATIIDPEEGPQTFLSQFEPATEDEISGIIKETGIKCSPADLLPQKLYEDNITNLIPLITELVNLSMATGSMEGVKLADIVPLIKDEKLDPNVLKNYFS